MSLATNMKELEKRINIFCVHKKDDFGDILCKACSKEKGHYVHCPLNFLKNYGLTEKLLWELWDKLARDLDYEGGGRHSCVICRGETEWKGKAVHHKKNCPSPLVKRILNTYFPNEYKRFMRKQFSKTALA